MGEIFEKPAVEVPLAWTGERLTSGAGPQVEIEHLHRYFLARSLCRGLDVLDVASGEGYGGALLAQTARSVIGVELDAESVAHACATYAAPNLRFQQGDACCLPLPDACVDIVVSFETIEHFYDHDRFLAELRRVLRPGGRAVVSSPERDVYSPAGAPPNPHHVRELTRAEFLALLRRHFGHVVLQGQRPLLGSALITEGERGAGPVAAPLTFERRGKNRFEQSAGLSRPVYLLAVVSDAPLESVPDSLYVDTSAIEEALVELPIARETLQRSTAALAAAGDYARHVEAELAARGRDLAELGIHARHIETELAAAGDYARHVEAELAARGRDLAELGIHARHIETELAARDRTLAELRVASEVALQEVTARQARMATHIDYVEAEFQKAATALQAGGAYGRDLESRLACLEAERADLHARLCGVVGSSSWRITQPLRRGLDRHPGTARALRRGAKLIWWTVTLQLPGRLAARRPTAALVPPSPPPAPDIAPPAPVIAIKPPPAAPGPSERDLFAATARGELLHFLASGERLLFPPAACPDISVVVILWNSAHLTLRCARALLAQSGPSFELVLFDNASSDETAQLLARIDGALVLRNASNDGFLIGCNRAVAAAHGRAVLLLNSDAFVRPGALAAALASLDADPDVGAVGGKLVLPTGLLQEAGSIVWSDASTLGYARGLDPDASETIFRRDVDYCSGAFLLTPRVLWDRLGGFDEMFVPAYYEDADYCMRLRDLGYRVVYEPRVVIDHYEFGSEARRGDADALSRLNRKRFRSRHRTALRRRHLPPSQDNILIARGHSDRGRGRMLVIDNELPLGELGSGYPRMRELLNEATTLGWSVTFFPLHCPKVDWDTAGREIALDIEIAAGRALPGLPAFLSERQGYFDTILISRPDNMRAVTETCRDRPHVFDGCRLIYDAEAMSCAREITRAAAEGRTVPDAEALISAEIGLADGADAIICVNQAEADIFGSRVRTPVHVLGHPTRPCAGGPGFAQRAGFLFVGRLLEREAPNWSGLAWFIRECWPRVRLALPDATLVVAGHLHSDHAELEAPGVQLCGPVADLRQLYDTARVFLAPVRFAAGIPIKILEATAVKLPTAGTRLMARQLNWTAGVEMVAEDDPAALATAIIELHGDAAQWDRIRTAAQERLGQEHGASAFRAALGAILDGPPPSPRSDTPDGLALPADAAIRLADSGDDDHRIDRVNEVWGGKNAVWSGPAKQWMSHPMVQKRINSRASGHPNIDAYARLKATLIDMGWTLPVPRAASLCCGEGSLERELVKQGYVRSIIGYDLAKDAIDEARRMAQAEGLAGLAYEVLDLEHSEFSETGLDVVFALSGLHHLSRLEQTFDAVHAALRPGGVFHVHEYVGPDRFQWTERQLREINSFLERLPERYRRLPDGSPKPRVTRPTIQEMLDTDPSEAVRSSRIEPLLAERFDILDRRELGGTLLHMALSNIAQNFDPAIAADRFWIMELFKQEDRLLREGAIGSDFTVVTARRR